MFKRQKYCFKKSFASYKGITITGKKKVDCWSDKNKCIPIEVSYSNGKKSLFDCDVCGHEFSSALSNIVSDKWCPYCSKKKRCNDLNCHYCFNNSFANYKGVTITEKI